jgi:hypothetical protein
LFERYKMILKERALSLLEEDVSNEELTVLTHGTSVEAVIEMFKTGKLPPSFTPNLRDLHGDQGYLFFLPRKRSFRDHYLHEKIEINVSGSKLEEGVKCYAQANQGKRFLIDTLGFWPQYVEPEELPPCGNWTLENLKKEGVDTDIILDYGLGKLNFEIRKRFGVCLGINREIFELQIEDGSDVPGGEVMISLPEGLDLKYVKYIFPFGELEEESIYSFIENLNS